MVDNSEDLPIVTTPVITSMQVCKRLFSGVVCCLTSAMCAVAWWDVTLATGCVLHGKTIGMPGKRFGFPSGQALLLM